MYSIVEYDECLICHDSILVGLSLFALITNDQICRKCRSDLKINIKMTKFHGHQLITLYKYELGRKLLIRYKDYLDTALSPIFLSPFNILSNFIFKGYSLVLIPSSESMRKRRGFDHLDLMLQAIRLKQFKILAKADSLQRFSKDRQVKFRLLNDQPLKKVIIFDDVITSGNSIKAALDLLVPISDSIIIICLFNNLSEVRE